MYVSPRHPDGPTLATRASDRLLGPRRTAWGTWCWSDPTAVEIGAFGPPPAMPPPPDPPPVDDVVFKVEVVDVMFKDGKVFFVSPHLSDDPERPSKINVIVDVSDKPNWVNPQ